MPSSSLSLRLNNTITNSLFIIRQMFDKDSKYKLINKISEGAFGTVYNALDTKTGIHYALKQVELTKNTLVNRQIKILKKLNHPNVIKLIEVEEKPFKINLIFQKYPYDLSNLIHSLQYPVNNNIVKHIFKQIVIAVQYIHKNKILHRDIKPSNLLINHKLQVKLCDFGSAVEISQKQTKGEFDLEGFTKWYKAPEMLFGDRRYNTSVDIWSLGCVFAELLTGIPLFTAGNQLQQIVRISDLLGSPDKDNWPSIVQLPDHGKILFKKKLPVRFQQYFVGVPKDALQVLGMMINYQKRASACDILKHKYFQQDEMFLQVRWRQKQAEDHYFNYQKLIPKETKDK